MKSESEEFRVLRFRGMMKSGCLVCRGALQASGCLGAVPT